MNWQLLFTIAALNLVIWLLHLLAQNADENRGKIQKRNTLISRSGGKKFLYLQDFLIHVWGSLIFLPLIAYAFFGFSVNGLEWIIFGIIFIVAVYMKIREGTGPKHKPDWAFPKGKEISYGGILHIIYTSAYVSAFGLCIIKTFNLELTGLSLLAAIIGAVGWGFLWFSDNAKGRYKKIEKTK